MGERSKKPEGCGPSGGGGLRSRRSHAQTPSLLLVSGGTQTDPHRADLAGLLGGVRIMSVSEQWLCAHGAGDAPRSTLTHTCQGAHDARARAHTHTHRHTHTHALCCKWVTGLGILWEVCPGGSDCSVEVKATSAWAGLHSPEPRTPFSTPAGTPPGLLVHNRQTRLQRDPGRLPTSSLLWPLQGHQTRIPTSARQ